MRSRCVHPSPRSNEDSTPVSSTPICDEASLKTQAAQDLGLSIACICKPVPQSQQNLQPAVQTRHPCLQTLPKIPNINDFTLTRESIGWLYRHVRCSGLKVPNQARRNTKPHHAVSGSRLLETNSSVRPEDLPSRNTSEVPEARIGGAGRGKDRLMQCLLYTPKQCWQLFRIL